jgi:GNAT superfamily N-acetyltransferase
MRYCKKDPYKMTSELKNQLYTLTLNYLSEQEYGMKRFLTKPKISKQDRIILAYSRGVIVGWGCLWAGSSCYIYVSPKYRKRGIGHALFIRLFKEYKSLKKKRGFDCCNPLWSWYVEYRYAL